LSRREKEKTNRSGKNMQKSKEFSKTRLIARPRFTL
jgi:hypothetical protein